MLYAQPIADCLRAVQAQCAEQGRGKPHIVFLTAGGRPYDQSTARRLAACDSLTLVCGHYEGIDERVIEAFADEEISIGDYVLTGGELASLVVADSVLRLQPGVLAEEQGFQEESHWDGLLEYPQYTRPEVWEGRAVPPVLLTGDHKKIAAWRARQSHARTMARRPDLYEAWCRTHRSRRAAGNAANARAHPHRSGLGRRGGHLCGGLAAALRRGLHAGVQSPPTRRRS